MVKFQMMISPKKKNTHSHCEKNKNRLKPKETVETKIRVRMGDENVKKIYDSNRNLTRVVMFNGKYSCIQEVCHKKKS